MSGAPPLGFFTAATGERRSARLNPDEAIAVLQGTAGTGDADVTAALNDVFPSGSGGARRRGGTRTREAVANLLSGMRTGAGGVVDRIDTAVASAIQALPTVLVTGGTVGTVVAALNHPTVFGNLAELSARVFQTGTNETITSTWGDWGAALVQLKDALGTVASTLASQTVQGPVIPAAIATLIMVARARANRRSFTEQIKSDAQRAGSAAARAATGQLQAFQDAFRAEAAQLGPAQLGRIARGIERTSGEGAAAASSATRYGAPAVSSTNPPGFGSAGVSGFASPPPRSALARLTSPGSSSSSSSAPLIAPSSSASSSAAAAPGRGTKRKADERAEAPGKRKKDGEGSDADDEDDAELGGRRRRGKSRKTRKTRGSRKTRRMTRRAKKITALKFVY